MKGVLKTLLISICFATGFALAQEQSAQPAQPAEKAQPAQKAQSAEEAQTAAAENDADAPHNPVIKNVTPNFCEQLDSETDVVITGESFSVGKGALAARVYANGKELPADIISPTEIRTQLPPRSKLGWVRMEVRNPDGQTQTLVRGFHYGPIRDDLAGLIRERFVAFTDRFSLGGEPMYIILALSILGLMWFIHCLFYLRPSRLLPPSFVTEVSALVTKGDFGAAQKACERNTSLLSRVTLAGIKRASDGPEKVADAVEAAGSRESAHLFQKISYLSNIGVISPMVGLFGTVLGMILVFDTVAFQYGAQQKFLAAGISKALYSTAFGLMVGIPAMVAFYFLRGKVIRLITDLEEDAEDLTLAMTRGIENKRN